MALSAAARQRPAVRACNLARRVQPRPSPWQRRPRQPFALLLWNPHAVTNDDAPACAHPYPMCYSVCSCRARPRPRRRTQYPLTTRPNAASGETTFRCFIYVYIDNFHHPSDLPPSGKRCKSGGRLFPFNLFCCRSLRGCTFHSMEFMLSCHEIKVQFQYGNSKLKFCSAHLGKEPAHAKPPTF